MSASSALASGESIIARARVEASQTAGDANSSAIIDSKGGARVLLNNAIRHLYRQKANGIKFRQDINVSNSVTITTGAGAVPPTLMREFLHQANISNTEGDLITFFSFPIDATSGQTYNQLGYLWITGEDVFNYRAPAPAFATYSGTLTVQCPSFPVFPADLADDITFPSLATIDDLVLTLSMAILGKIDFQDV